jgi:alanine racemase
MSSSNSIDLDIKETNAIRIGLGLYGLKDIENTKQVLSMYSPITNITLIKKNEFAGYDNSFKANSDGYIYTIPLGYQSGLLSKYKLTPSIDNKRLYTAGKRCMNQTLLFSKNLYFLGQMVCIIDENHSLIKIAKSSNQSIYEVISLFNQNIKRLVI